MNYRVVILCAGKGSRLGRRTIYLNKALLKVGDKAVISHTIDSFPKEIEFVIALGYQGDIVRQYLKIIYPERRFIFVGVDKFEGVGSGPGYSLTCCKKELQCPFYYVSCDAIINWKYVFHNKMNWAAWCDIDKSEIKNFCTLDIKNDWGDYTVTGFYNKSEKGTTNAFTGVAFINDYQIFWDKMSLEKISEEGEIQVAPVILSISNISALPVDWWDVGSEEGLRSARGWFDGFQNLDKVDEEIYFVNGCVIKYFYNESMVRGRIERLKHFGTAAPKLLGNTKNFYKYEFIQGNDLFLIKNQDEIIESLLKYCKGNLWKDVVLDEQNVAIFRSACRRFYQQKTSARVDKYFDKTETYDREHIINNEFIPRIKAIFDLMDWNWLSNGIPSNFHGDLALGNILLSGGDFKFIDWRQDFSGLIDYGDRYYDFAKLYASFMFPLPSVRNKKFVISVQEQSVEVNIEVSQSIQKAKQIFEKWIINEGYDLRKIKILTGIVLLNMSPLHETPLDKYLFYFAKKYLYNMINEAQ
mgnify:CR=1 FL=1